MPLATNDLAVLFVVLNINMAAFDATRHQRLAVLFVVLNINMAAFDATRHQWPSSPLCCPQY